MRFYIDKVKRELFYAMFSDQYLTPQLGTEGENVTVLHIWADTELMTLMLSAHHKTVLIV